ncbi:MAG: hypothetical protein PVG78_00435 [Desulfobacterales bacterium]
MIIAHAGIGTGERIERSAFHHALETVRGNLLGAIATVDTAVNYFRRQNGGHIAGTISVAAFR